MLCLSEPLPFSLHTPIGGVRAKRPQIPAVSEKELRCAVRGQLVEINLGKVHFLRYKGSQEIIMLCQCRPPSAKLRAALRAVHPYYCTGRRMNSQRNDAVSDSRDNPKT